MERTILEQYHEEGGGRKRWWRWPDEGGRFASSRLSLSLSFCLFNRQREREKQRGSSQRISEKEGGGSEERREIIERLFAWFESVRESAIGSARTCAVNSGNVAPGAAPKNGRKIRTRDNWRPDEYRKSTRPTCPSWLKCTTNAALYDDTE